MSRLYDYYSLCYQESGLRKAAGSALSKIAKSGAVKKIANKAAGYVDDVVSKVDDIAAKFGSKANDVAAKFGNKADDVLDDIIKPFAAEKNKVAVTSRNFVPELHRKIDLKPGTINHDLGGGKYDKATEFLKSKGVKNVVVDPYSRTTEHNLKAVGFLAKKGADSVTCSNVLNVIQDPAIRAKTIQQAKQFLKPGGKIYWSIFEGNGKGIGAKTSTGSWQNNKKAVEYLDEIKKFYPNTVKVGRDMLVSTLD